MKPLRTFKAEFRRLRSIARSEGRDPYVPAEPFVSVGERYRRSKLPRQRRVSAAEVAQIWADVNARAPVDNAWATSALFKAFSR
jgi:hypothetical protein